MKRVSFLHILLEIIVILGNLIIGITVLTYLNHGSHGDQMFVGMILLAIGIIEFTGFMNLKFITKIKSIQNAVVAVLTVALGVIFMVAGMDISQMCLIWGICFIVFSVAKISASIVNLGHQPLLNTVVIVLCIIEIVFSIFLIVQRQESLDRHLVYLGISLVIKAVVLLIEFIVHRYQR